MGAGSGVNNAVARAETLLSVALFPLAAGVGGLSPADPAEHVPRLQRPLGTGTGGVLRDRAGAGFRWHP